jgi:hypothetical protein
VRIDERTEIKAMNKHNDHPTYSKGLNIYLSMTSVSRLTSSSRAGVQMRRMERMMIGDVSDGMSNSCKIVFFLVIVCSRSVKNDERISN